MSDWLKEICGSCGCRRGAHCGSSYYSEHYQMFIPQGYCPGHEGRMDWDKGPGTTFVTTGRYQKEAGNDDEGRVS